MEYRGIEYQVVHSINGGKWKWSAELSGRRNHGEARLRDDALAAAKKAIDRSLEPRKVRLLVTGLDAAQVSTVVMVNMPKIPSFVFSLT